MVCCNWMTVKLTSQPPAPCCHLPRLKGKTLNWQNLECTHSRFKVKNGEKKNQADFFFFFKSAHHWGGWTTHNSNEYPPHLCVGCNFFQMIPCRDFLNPCRFQISRGHKAKPLSSCIIYGPVKGPNYIMCVRVSVFMCVFHQAGAAGLTLKCGFSTKRATNRGLWNEGTLGLAGVNSATKCWNL